MENNKLSAGDIEIEFELGPTWESATEGRKVPFRVCEVSFIFLFLSPT
jgi:hypothetical protein